MINWVNDKLINWLGKVIIGMIALEWREICLFMQ